MDQPNLRDRPIPRADRFETIGLAVLHPGRLSIRPTRPVHAYRLEGVLTDQADMEARADWHYIDMFRTLSPHRTNLARAKAASLYVAQAEAAAYARAAEVARNSGLWDYQMRRSGKDIATAIEALGEAKG